MNIDFTKASWINPPRKYRVAADEVEMVTDPGTDFWQRSYYGFRNENAPALLLDTEANFTFTARVTFAYRKQFDQCGLMVFLDQENWFKASIEFETSALSRLGSVVTNFGYSDWATTDLQTPESCWYRLSRRGPDFLIESSADGRSFNQMRVFHLHQLGETTPGMGKSDPPLPPEKPVRFGIYACSPNSSSFTALFSHFKMEECRWTSHGAS